VLRRFGKDLKGRRFALWGLAFKPRTDDVREAPAIDVARGLLAAGGEVVGNDPEAISTMRAAFDGAIRYEPDPYRALEGADALVLCTEWNEYRGANLDRVAAALKHKVIFDGRNVFDPEGVRARGFEYFGIGR